MKNISPEIACDWKINIYIITAIVVVDMWIDFKLERSPLVLECTSNIETNNSAKILYFSNNLS